MEVFHIRKYGRFTLSEICHFLEQRVVPWTDPWVPGSGDLECSLNGDPEVRVLPRVRGKMIPEYFSQHFAPYFQFRHRFQGITCALESTRVAHFQQVPPQAGQHSKDLYLGSFIDRSRTSNPSGRWLLCGGLGLSDASLVLG